MGNFPCSSVLVEAEDKEKATETCTRGNIKEKQRSLMRDFVE